MQGLHLTADLRGCPAGQPAMTTPQALRELCVAAVRDAGLLPVGECFHGFPPENGEPRGVTGVVLLAESHVAVHTWPEIDGVTLDVYVCNLGADNSAKAHRLLDTLLAAFAPASVSRHALRRGEPSSPRAAAPGLPAAELAGVRAVQAGAGRLGAAALTPAQGPTLPEGRSPYPASGEPS